MCWLFLAVPGRIFLLAVMLDISLDYSVISVAWTMLAVIQ